MVHRALEEVLQALWGRNTEEESLLYAESQPIGGQTSQQTSMWQTAQTKEEDSL